MRSPRARAGRGRIVLCGVVASLAGVAILAGCVDGVTPDCSDASTQCGPDVDGSADSNEAALLPEAAPRDSAAADAQGVADATIDLDAGDEG